MQVVDGSLDVAGPDGRRARRDRNRAAVVEAVFSLLYDGHVPPSTEQVAERAGVSVSSVFRYFESIDDLQQQTIEAYFDRFAPLFELPKPGGDSQPARITALVEARLVLSRETAPVQRLARMRAPEHPLIAGSLAETRTRLTRQVRTHFRPDLVGLSRSRTDEVVGLVDVLTSFESWDRLRSGLRLSEERVADAWTDGVQAVLALPR